MDFFYEIMLVFVKTTRFFYFLFLGTLEKVGNKRINLRKIGNARENLGTFEFSGNGWEHATFLGTCDSFWEQAGISGNVPKFGTPMHIILEASSPSDVSHFHSNCSCYFTFRI
jgi:hypothetical protein